MTQPKIQQRVLPMGALAFLMLCVGCASSSGGPRGVTTAYGKALGKKDYGVAYEMMSVEYRNRVSKDEYVGLMKASENARRETARVLSRGGGALDIAAEVEYGELGETLQLVYQDGGWKIASNPIAFYDASTPRNAIRSFIRAYRMQRWSVLHQLAPKEYRAQMTVEEVKEQFAGSQKEVVEKLIDTIALNIRAPIEEKWDEAVMIYHESREVRFVREDDGWKIKDLD